MIYDFRLRIKIKQQTVCEINCSIKDAAGLLCTVHAGRRIICPGFVTTPAEPANAYTSFYNVLLGFAAKQAAGCRHLQVLACIF